MTFSVIAAFLAGFAGSAHCLAMCGGISSALGMRARAAGVSAAHALLHSSLYQLGRLASYALAGALGGALGGGLLRMLDVARATHVLRTLVAVLLLLLGWQLCTGWRLLAPVEAVGARLWRRMMPWSSSCRTQAQWLQALLLGALWGWLPCGLVYSMLLLGVLGGSSAHGAGVMLAFGLGTLPAVLGSSLLAAQVARAAHRQKLTVLSGLLLILFGAWTLLTTWQHVMH